ncbi:MAG: hypothetical protein M8866_07430 [marine benthic group bacterium]|nr:hypothetical protein [Candidatus Benthicola marisminoris]
MRILVGTRGGLYVVRWVHGERSAQVEESHFEGDDVRAIVPAGRSFYTAVSGHGVWKSEDQGRTWEQMTGPFDGHVVRSLAVSHRDPQILYAGTRPAALHISRDGGSKWEEMTEFRVLGVREGWKDTGEGSSRVETVAADPHDSSRLYAGVEIGGAYRSDDGGQTWTGCNEGLFDEVHVLLPDPLDSSRVYAATGGGFHISRDRGRKWTAHAGEPGEAYCTCLDAEFERGARDSLLVMATAAGPPATWEGSRGDAKARLLVSRDSGETWEAFKTSTMGEKGAFTALATDRTAQQSGFIGTSTGRLYYGNAVLGRWSKILYGLPRVQVLQVL